MYKLLILIFITNSLLFSKVFANNKDSLNITLQDSIKSIEKKESLKMIKANGISDSTIINHAVINDTLITKKTNQDTIQNLLLLDSIKTEKNKEKQIVQTQIKKEKSSLDNMKKLSKTYQITDAIDIMTDSIVNNIKKTSKNSIIAINKFSGDNKDVSSVVSEYTLVDITKKGLAIVSKDDYKKAIDEISLSQTGITDEALAPKVGKLVSATHILTGSVFKVGLEQIITIKVTNVETGKISYAISSKVTQIDTPKIYSLLTKERKSVSSYIFRSVIPGGGQFYAGKTVRGILWVTLFTASAAYSGYSIYETSKAKNNANDYWDSMPPANSQLTTTQVKNYNEILYPTYLSLYSDYEDEYDKSVIAVSVTAGVWLLNIIDATIIGVSESKKVDLYFSATTDGLKTNFAYNF